MSDLVGTPEDRFSHNEAHFASYEHSIQGVQRRMVLVINVIIHFLALLLLFLSRDIRKSDFAYAKTKTQISFAVTARLISAFVFATRIVQSLFFLNPKFQAFSHLLWLYSPICVGPGRKPRRPAISQRGSFDLVHDAGAIFRLP